MWRIALALLLACSGNEPRCADAPQPEASPVGPRAPRQLRDVRRLVVDVAAVRACDALQGRIMAVSDDDDLVTGRIWLRGCDARPERDRLALHFDALVWTWADERSDAMGATFQVQQHVFLDAEATLRAVPELSYDRSCGYGYLWLRPDVDPEVSARSIRPVDADPEGAWSHVVGVFARMIGRRPDDEARRIVDEQGDRELEEVVDEGFTIYSDLCTSDVGMEMGRLTEPPFARPRRGEAAPPTRVRIHRGGLDVHGPISDGERMLVRATVEAGGPVRARLVCEDDAARLMNAFARGEPLPQLDAIAEVRAAPRGELRGGRRCPMYLATEPLTERTTTLSFTVQPVRDRRVALVPGCRGRCLSRG